MLKGSDGEEPQKEAAVVLEALAPWTFGAEQLSRCLCNFLDFPFGLCLVFAGAKELVLKKSQISQAVDKLAEF